MLGVRFDNVDDGGRIVAFTSSHHHEVTKNSDGTVLITLSCCKCKNIGKFSFIVCICITHFINKQVCRIIYLVGRQDMKVNKVTFLSVSSENASKLQASFRRN